MDAARFSLCDTSPDGSSRVGGRGAGTLGADEVGGFEIGTDGAPLVLAVKGADSKGCPEARATFELAFGRVGERGIGGAAAGGPLAGIEGFLVNSGNPEAFGTGGAGVFANPDVPGIGGGGKAGPELLSSCDSFCSTLGGSVGTGGAAALGG